MTFAEFGAACSGFEAFHCPEDKKTRAPSDEEFMRWTGQTQH